MTKIAMIQTFPLRTSYPLAIREKLSRLMKMVFPTIYQPGQGMYDLNQTLDFKMSRAALGTTFLPSDVSGLLCWHDFSIIGNLFQDAAKTIPVVADGDVIGAVVDRSGNSRDATTNTNKPNYKTNIQNGMSAVLGLSSGAGYLATPSITHGIGTGDFLWMVVIKTGVVGNIAIWKIICSLGADAPVIAVRGSQKKFSFYWGVETPFSTVPSDNTTYIVELWRSSGVFYLSLNGVTDATTISKGTSLPNGIFYLLNDLYTQGLRGYMMEWTFYNDYPSANIAALRTYFNDKWAVY